MNAGQLRDLLAHVPEDTTVLVDHESFIDRDANKQQKFPTPLDAYYGNVSGCILLSGVSVGSDVGPNLPAVNNAGETVDEVRARLIRESAQTVVETSARLLVYKHGNTVITFQQVNAPALGAPVYRVTARHYIVLENGRQPYPMVELTVDYPDVAESHLNKAVLARNLADIVQAMGRTDIETKPFAVQFIDATPPTAEKPEDAYDRMRDSFQDTVWEALGRHIATSELHNWLDDAISNYDPEPL